MNVSFSPDLTFQETSRKVETQAYQGSHIVCISFCSRTGIYHCQCCTTANVTGYRPRESSVVLEHVSRSRNLCPFSPSTKSTWWSTQETKWPRAKMVETLLSLSGPLQILGRPRCSNTKIRLDLRTSSVVTSPYSPPDPFFTSMVLRLFWHNYPCSFLTQLSVYPDSTSSDVRRSSKGIVGRS